MPDAASALTQLLFEGGVRRFYCVPGESYLGVIDAAARHDGLRLVSTRHESGAAFMAEADGKITGEPAVFAATRAVGAANGAIGVHTAFQDSTPMVVLLGQVETGFLGREAFQEVDLPDFYRQITKWSVTAHRADRIPELISEALRICRSGRPGPVMIALPSDLLGADVAESAVAAGSRRLSMALGTPEAALDDCRAAARRLAAAKRPVIIAGGGTRHARRELMEVSERYSTGVYAAFRRQDVFPNDHDLYLGHLGLGITGRRLDALKEADLVMVIGCRLSEITTGGYELPLSSSEILQVDIDPSVIGAITPVSLGLIADARSFLRALAELPDVVIAPRDWSAARQAFLDAAQIPEPRSESGIDPAQVIASLARTMPPDAIMANDAGNFSAFLHQHWLYRAANSQVAPTSGAMGYAVPAAIAAKIAQPSRTAIAVAGDGGFSMSAIEIETAVREDIEVIVVVMSNGLQGTIAMHQARNSGRLSGVSISAYDVALLARSLGANGVTVSAVSDLDDALADTSRSGGVTVVGVQTDHEIISTNARLSELLGAGAERGTPKA